MATNKTTKLRFWIKLKLDEHRKKMAVHQQYHSIFRESTIDCYKNLVFEENLKKAVEVNW